MTTLTVASFFSGIGIFDLAFALRGAQIVAQSEIDPFCCEILQLRAPQFWPHTRLFGDINDITHNEFSDADVFVAGFPCQPHSLAGDRKGIDDARWLWPALANLIKAKRPRAILLENVAGFPTSSDGDALKCVLSDLAACGYDAECDVVSANASVGAPHLRERWWCVGTLANASSVRQPQSADASGRDPNTEWHMAQAQQKRHHQQHPTGRACHALDAGRQGRGNEPRLGGMQHDGVATWLERPDSYPHWARRMGELPAAYEQARLAPATATNAKRVQALGNGVVFPQALMMADVILGRLR